MHGRIEKNLGLYYFASIDIVGSTAFKVKKQCDLTESKLNTLKTLFEKLINKDPEKLKELQAIEDFEPWLITFENFYKELPSRLDAILSESDIDSVLKVWKLNGDEILFYSHLKDSNDVKVIFDALNKVCEEYSVYLNDDLGLKICSWMAGVPVINSRIEDEGMIGVEQLLTKTENITDKNKEDILNKLTPKIEFIGPSIDAGFRLAKYAKENTHIISIEVALVLATINSKYNPGTTINIYYEKDQVLKGVLENKPYPLFYYIFLYSDKIKLEKKRLNLQGKEQIIISPDDLLKLCNSLIEEVNNEFLITPPYIIGDTLFGKAPDSHSEKRREFCLKNKEEEEQLQYYDCPISNNENEICEDIMFKSPNKKEVINKDIAPPTKT